MPATSPKGIARLAIASIVFLLLSACSAETGLPNREKGTLSVDGTLTRKSVSLGGQQSLPMWQIDLTISNGTGFAVELGEVLILVATTPNNEITVGLVRDRVPPKGCVRAAHRYGLDWAVEVPTQGSAFWPFGALAPEGTSFADLLFLTAAVPFLEPYDALGYGSPIAAGETRQLAETFPFPFNVEVGSEWNSLIVVAPALTASNSDEAIRSVSHTALTFDVHGNVENGYVVKQTSVQTWTVPSAEVRAVVKDAAQPAWLRVAAMNWLAEADASSTFSLLQELAVGAQEPALLRNSALVSLGAWRVPGALSVLTSAVESDASDHQTRYCSLLGLADFGDATAASIARGYLEDDNDSVSVAAMKAVGALRDADAVSALSGILAGGAVRETRRFPAAEALAAIGTEAAHAALLTVVKSRAAGFRSRVAAMAVLGKAKLEISTEAIRAVALDDAEEVGISMNAVNALVAIGTAPAMAGARQAVASKRESIRREAVQRLAQSGDADALTFVAELAGKEGPVRDVAIRSLGDAKATSAAPIVRQVVASSALSDDLRATACGALGKMADRDAQVDLIAAARDPSEKVSRSALEALSTIFGSEARPSALEGLGSPHPSVRMVAATALAKMAPPATDALWAAFQAEREASAGEAMASSLIALNWSDRTAAGWLVGRLDDKTNQLWFEDVRLLRHLTQQTIGPDSKYVDEEKRRTELTRWAEWWTEQGNVQP